MALFNNLPNNQNMKNKKNKLNNTAKKIITAKVFAIKAFDYEPESIFLFHFLN